MREKVLNNRIKVLGCVLLVAIIVAISLVFAPFSSYSASYEITSVNDLNTALSGSATTNGGGVLTINLKNSSDFIILSHTVASVYQNATIIVSSASGESIDLSKTATYNSKTLSFNGLGTDSYPFSGSFTCDIPIPTPCSLFNALNTSATIGSLTIQRAKDNDNTPLFADKISGTSTATYSLTCQSYEKEEENGTKSVVNYSFAGIIGEISADSTVNLSVADTSTSEAKSNATLGYFCNKLSGSLLINSFNRTNLTVTTTSGFVGGYIGEMTEGSRLTINSFAPTINGTIKSSNNYAGSLVGKLTKATVSLGNNVTINTTVTGKVGAGGFIGCAINPYISVAEGKNISLTTSVISNAATEITTIDANGLGGIYGKLNILSDFTASAIDLKPFIITSTTLTGNVKLFGIGGAIGAFYNENKNITLNVGNDISSTYLNNPALSFGGLIGSYAAGTRTAGLKIDGISGSSNVTVSSSLTGSNAITTYSGLIGRLVAIGTDSYSYVEVENITVSVYANPTITTFGGIVGDMGTGNMLNLSETVKVTNESNTDNIIGIDTKSRYAGGIVGSLTNGVIRLSGTTDVSTFTPRATDNVYAYYGQVVGNNNSGLVYAIGSGNSDSNWIFKRNTGAYVNDIASYDEVIRLNTSTALTGIGYTEKKGTGAISLDGGELIGFSTDLHYVILASPTTTISNARDFATVSLALQCKGNDNSCFIPKYLSDLTFALGGDVDLSGTGIVGLLKDNGSKVNYGANGASSAYWGGIFNGNGHKVTLSIGEVYGVDTSGNNVTSDTEGCGQIYSYAGICHSYIGLFSYRGWGNNITNLTIDGTIDCRICRTVNQNQYVFVGGMIGYAGNPSNNTVFENDIISVEMNIKFLSNNLGNAGCLAAGGFIGYFDDTGAKYITFCNCTWNGNINYYEDSALQRKSSKIAGYIGGAHQNASVDFVNCVATGTIISDRADSDGGARYGCLMGEKYSDNGYSGKCNITNVLIKDCTIEVKAGAKYMGGAFGFYWQFDELKVTGLKIAGCTFDTHQTAVVGAVAFRGAGVWKVQSNSNSSYYTKFGIEYAKSGDKSNTISCATNIQNGCISALIVSRVDTWGGNFPLYLDIGTKPGGTSDYCAYKIQSDSVTLSSNITSSAYFDEVAGNTLKDTKKNGVVSFEISSDTIDTTGCNTYKKQLSTDYNNPYARYYYNLDTYRNGAAIDASNITTAEQLLLYSVSIHCADKLSSYFATNNNNATISGDIDLTGLSYYPVDLPSGYTANLNNANLTFAYSEMNAKETGDNNKEFSNNLKQHYLMQFGLFRNAESSTINVTNSSLSGNIGFNNTYSGALVCGTGKGSSTNNINNYFTLRIDGLILDGIGLNGYANSTNSLLVRKVDSFSKINISGVTTSNYTDAQKTAKVASSLLEYVGNETDGQYISVVFDKMDLDGHVNNTIFKHSTFIYSFKYKDEKSCSGQYTFVSTDPVTYGKEISNSVASDRNPDLQYYYYRTTTPVTDGSITSNVGSGFNVSSILRYVYTKEDKTNNTYEIDVNIAFVNLNIGCGTAADPYIVDDGAVLETLATYLNNGAPTNWIVCINKTVSATDSQGTEADSNHEYYILKGDTWYTITSYTDDRTYTVGSEKSSYQAFMRQYLANAYYKIVEDIEIGQNGTYVGIGANAVLDGTSTTGYSAFSGYIYGQKEDASIPTVNIYSPLSTVTQFGGLVAYGNGCVIKDLNINYVNNKDGNGIRITSTAKPESMLYSKQIFFGGIIGYVVGGDNIIENVAIDFSHSSVSVDGTYDYLANVGGYVGLVGGNSTSEAGGGVIFRNITSNGLASINGASIPSDKYYWNAYVGRVLDGYAFSEVTSINNTDKNYTIPKIQDSVSVSYSTAEIKGDNIPEYTVTVDNADEAWIISALVNSGASTQGQNNKFQTSAYKFGRCWTSTTTSSYWGGTDIASKQSYLVEKYTSDASAASKMSGGYTANLLNVNGNLDFTSFGNGFRGIGSTYSDFFIINGYSKMNSILYFWNRGVAGNEHTITMNRHLYEYEDEVWYAQVTGFFPIISIYGYYKDYTTRKVFEKLTISGEIVIDYNGNSKANSWCYNGGFVGAYVVVAGNSNKYKGTTIQNIKLNNLTVSGGRYSGGFAGWVGKFLRMNYSVSYKGEALGDVFYYNCSYNNIHVTGLYVAGGFIGGDIGNTIIVSDNLPKDSEKLTFKGENSTVTILGDKNCEVYKTFGNNYSKEYAGAGGFAGHLTSHFKVNKDNKTTDSFILNNIVVSGPQLQYNTNHGIGGIVGSSYEGREHILNRIKIINSTIKTNMSDDFESVNKTLLSNSYWVGGLEGYCRPLNSVSINNCEVSNCKLIYSSNIGGLLGCAKNVLIDNSSINNCILFSQMIQNYQGPARVSGVVAYIGDVCDNNISNLVIDSNIIINQGKVGGIVADLVNGSVHLKNAIISHNVMGNNSSGKDYYVKEANTDPGQKNNSEVEISIVDTVGGIIGVDRTGNSTNAVYGHNVEMTDNLIGYILDSSGKFVPWKTGSGLTAEYTPLTLENVSSLTYESTNRIGLKNKVGSTISYSSYENMEVSTASDYTEGRIGLIHGGANNDSNKIEYKIQGLSVSGYLPNEIVGNSKISDNSYIIYSNNQQDKTNTTESATPYMDVNPLVSTNGLKLYGDGASISGASAIISNYANYKNTKYNNVYHYVAPFESGSYKSYVKKYSEEESTVIANDYEILVLSDINNADTIIRSYIKMVTNSLYEDYSTTIQTYKLVDGTYTAADKNSIFITSAGKFAVSSGCYDNGIGQITVITVTYTTDGNTFKIDIPVLVKKVLQYQVYAAAIPDTPYYASAYESLLDPVLSDYGEKVTLRIQYIYERTIDEWQTALDGGENLLSVLNNRQFMFGEAAKLPNNTQMILVDSNHPSDAYYNNLANETNTVSFTDFAGWEDVPLYERLDLSAQEDSENGLFVETDESNASVKVGDNYYRLASEDETALTHYVISVDGFKSPSQLIDEKDYLTDYYYITFYIPTGTKIANMLTEFTNIPLSTGLSTTKVNTIYHISNAGAENRFIYTCQLFNQNLSISTDTPAEIEDGVNFKIIEIEAANTISLADTEDARTIYTNYITEHTNLSYGILLKTKNYENTTTSSSYVITSGTSIDVEYVVTYVNNEGTTVTENIDETYNVTTNSSSVLLEYPDSVMQYLKNSQNNSVSIVANISMKYNAEGIINQFPQFTGSVNNIGFGLDYSGVGKLSYAKSNLRTSTTVSATKETGTHFYTLERKIAKVSYEAYDKTNLKYGDVGQLGINASPVENENETDYVNITTAATYDATSTNADGATKLYVKINLYKKLETGDYTLVANPDDHLKNIVLSYSGNDYAGTISTAYSIPLADESYKNIPVEFDIAYDVVTGSTLEKMNGQYSNYKVEIVVDLMDSAEHIFGYNASDYIIYSNVRINADMYN